MPNWSFCEAISANLISKGFSEEEIIENIELDHSTYTKELCGYNLTDTGHPSILLERADDSIRLTQIFSLTTNEAYTRIRKKSFLLL